MSRFAFLRPVTVLVGLGMPRRLDTVTDALECLETFPSPTRDEAYHAAREVCLDALSGQATVQEANDVLAALARRRGMLVEDEFIGPHAVKSTGRLAA